MSDVAELVGKTLADITVSEGGYGITFTLDDGRRFAMDHRGRTWEWGVIDGIQGDLADLLGSPILTAERSGGEENPPSDTGWGYEPSTWRFYRFATAKGRVFLRWYDFYGGSPQFQEIKT